MSFLTLGSLAYSSWSLTLVFISLINDTVSWLSLGDLASKIIYLSSTKIELSGFPLESWEILCFVPAKELFYL